MSEPVQEKTNDKKVSTMETDIACLKKDVEYIKESLNERFDSLSERLDNMNYKESFEKQGERIGNLEKKTSSLETVVKGHNAILGIIGTAAVGGLITAILNIILK